MKDKNAIVGLMLEIDYLKKEISMYESLAELYRKDTMPNSYSMYVGLKRIALRKKMAICEIKNKLSKVGIDYGN